MATHFSVLAGRMLWTEEPGGSQRVGQSIKSQRVRQDPSNLACMHAEEQAGNDTNKVSGTT